MWEGGGVKFYFGETDAAVMCLMLKSRTTYVAEQIAVVQTLQKTKLTMHPPHTKSQMDTLVGIHATF